jgi:hypothetical protein
LETRSPGTKEVNGLEGPLNPRTQEFQGCNSGRGQNKTQIDLPKKEGRKSCHKTEDETFKTKTLGFLTKTSVDKTKQNKTNARQDFVIQLTVTKEARKDTGSTAPAAANGSSVQHHKTSSSQISSSPRHRPFFLKSPPKPLQFCLRKK